MKFEAGESIQEGVIRTPSGIEHEEIINTPNSADHEDMMDTEYETNGVAEEGQFGLFSPDDQVMFPTLFSSL